MDKMKNLYKTIRGQARNYVGVSNTLKELVIPKFGFKGRIMRGIKDELSTVDYRYCFKDVLKDYPSLANAAATCYSECYARGHRCSDEGRDMKGIVKNIGKAVTASVLFYIPLAFIEDMRRWGGYLPKEIVEGGIEDRHSSDYIGGVLNAGVLLPKVSSELNIPRYLMWEEYNALLAIAGTLVNRRCNSGRHMSIPALLYDPKHVDMSQKEEYDGEVRSMIPEILDKYKRLFGVGFSEDCKVKERLEAVVNQSEHYYNCLLG